MSGLLGSRKFNLLVLDTVVSAVILIGGWYLAPDDLEKVIAVMGLLQPVFYAVINGITREDVAKLEAGVHVTQQRG